MVESGDALLNITLLCVEFQVGHIFHATHALEGVQQQLDDLLVTVVNNCGEEFHISKLFLTTVQMYVRVAVVTDHLEAPKIGAGRARSC